MKYHWRDGAAYTEEQLLAEIPNLREKAREYHEKWLYTFERREMLIWWQAQAAGYYRAAQDALLLLMKEPSERPPTRKKRGCAQ